MRQKRRPASPVAVLHFDGDMTAERAAQIKAAWKGAMRRPGALKLSSRGGLL